MFEAIFPKSYVKANRTLTLNDPQRSEFPSNRIKTSKYNIINFFPKCLFLQFMRVANFYFLATAVVQSISIISPLAPFTAIAPLVFVLLVSLIREAIDDIVTMFHFFEKFLYFTFLYISIGLFVFSWFFMFFCK